MTQDNNVEGLDIQEQSVANTTIENMSNDTLALAIDSKLGYDFTKFLLVKPLEIEKTFKTLTVPEDSGEKDADDKPIMQMTIKQVEVDSAFRKGVVISIPASLTAVGSSISGLVINSGDIIVYPNKRSMDFDLYKDSVLVEPYEVVAIVR